VLRKDRCIDVHAFLDNLKAPIELINHRVNYYSRVIQAALRAIGVSTERLEFITGSSYQYEPNYNRDKYRLCAITSEHDARKAGAEVVKQTQSPPLSGLLYPLLQALDEEYLDVDVQFGGVDQVCTHYSRRIFLYSQAEAEKRNSARSLPMRKTTSRNSATNHAHI
jgi:tyrosyl-tRNA synthetase